MSSLKWLPRQPGETQRSRERRAKRVEAYVRELNWQAYLKWREEHPDYHPVTSLADYVSTSFGGEVLRRGIIKAILDNAQRPLLNFYDETVQIDEETRQYFVDQKLITDAQQGLQTRDPEAT